MHVAGLVFHKSRATGTTRGERRGLIEAASDPMAGWDALASPPPHFSCPHDL